MTFTIEYIVASVRKRTNRSDDLHEGDDDDPMGVRFITHTE